MIVYVCIYIYIHTYINRKANETNQMLSAMLFAASPDDLLAGPAGQPLLAGWPFYDVYMLRMRWPA